MKRKYHVNVNWTHRRWGPQMEKLVGEATSIRRALNAVLLAFFKDKSKRKNRLDAHAHIRVEIWRVKR